MRALVASMLVAAAAASCPSACSGHGKCTPSNKVRAVVHRPRGTALSQRSHVRPLTLLGALPSRGLYDAKPPVHPCPHTCMYVHAHAPPLPQCVCQARWVGLDCSARECSSGLSWVTSKDTNSAPAGTINLAEGGEGLGGRHRVSPNPMLLDESVLLLIPSRTHPGAALHPHALARTPSVASKRRARC